MNIKKIKVSDTSIQIDIIANEVELEPVKKHVLQHFAKRIKIQGFREGKAPLAMVEKQADPSSLQTEFLEHAIEDLYIAAVNELKLRVVGQPQINLTKFVPFTTIEFSATAEVIGDIVLASYKTMKLAKQVVLITADEINEVVDSLQKRLAQKNDVTRAAKKGDEATIDFSGIDDKGQPVKGADGKDYPLLLGSTTFIPGFEDNIIGLKLGDEKTFTLTFPKDYGVKALAKRDVTFTITISKLQALTEPKADDAFAAQAGPFTTLKELKADIKKQLSAERQQQADRNYESDLVRNIADKSTVPVPQVLIDEQVEKLLGNVQQNLLYRGQTFPDFLAAEGKTEEEYKKDILSPEAKESVKAGLVLAEIADQEDLRVTPEELSIRTQLLKGQYKDAKMREEINKPQNQQDIAARLLTEKTVLKIVQYATKTV